MSGQGGVAGETGSMVGSLNAWMLALRRSGVHNGALLAFWPLIIVVFSLAMPGLFLQVGTAQSIAFQLPELGLLSLAMVIPLISGGLNLAVVATANQTGLLMVWIMSTHIGAHTDPATMWFWIIAALASGLLLAMFIGLVTGALIAVVGVHPILVTLGSMTLIGGWSIFLTRGKTLSGVPDPVVWISNGTLAWIPISFILFCLVTIGIHILMTKTALGLRIHMIGSNLEATRYSGVNTTKALISVYVLSSALCWMAGVVMMARFNSAGADFAQSYLLITVLAAILGGVDPYGGFGRISGLFLSLLILQTVSSGFNLLGLSSQLTLASWGAILIVVIAVQRFVESWRGRRSANPIRALSSGGEK
jgi:simple sugar transport system permease protein